MPPLAASILTFNATSDDAANNNTGFYDAATYFLGQLPELNAARLIGYIDISPATLGSVSSPMTFYGILYVLSSINDLHTVLDPIVSRINSTNGTATSVFTQQFADFEAFRQSVMVSASVGLNYIGGSWLWDEAALKDTTGVQNVGHVFSADWLQISMVSGPGVRAVGLNDTAVNPAWRQSVVEMSKSA